MRFFIVTSLLYVVYTLNYIVLKETEQNLYQCNYFEFNYDFLNIIIFYFLSVPFISYILKKSNENIFSMLLSTLLIVGVLPGVVVLCFDMHSVTSYFFMFFVYLLFIFSLLKSNFIFTKKNITKEVKQYEIEMNVKLFKIIGFIGFFIYLYVFIRYINFLDFKSMGEVYVQRALSKELISNAEGYLIMFTKNLAAFSLLILALKFRMQLYVWMVVFIFATDYAFGAHKSSLFVIAYTLFYYYFLSKFDLKKYYYVFATILIVLVSILLNYVIVVDHPYLTKVIGLYDRAFHTNIGLFARIYEYCNEFGFFYGGNGFIGKLFLDAEDAISGTKTIGSYFFYDGVQSNTNFIANGYLNFGYIGSFVQIFILWLLFNKKDDFVFKTNFIIILPLIFMYSKLLNSVGIQTALLSGSMILFVFLIKYGFKIKYS